jgi:hypothetical protein
MTRVPMTQAVAADYADAMLVARRAKNVLFLLLALILVIQMGVFFVVKYVPNVKIHAEIATTSDVTTTGATLLERNAGGIWSPLLEQVIAATDFLGVLFSMVLPVILLLVITIMLVGRLVGVSHVTSAFCWSIVFLVLLFPWQSLLNSHVHAKAMTSITGGVAATQPTEAVIAVDEAPDIRIPGVLYTFPELRRNYGFANTPLKPAILGWGRFVGVPIVALFILLLVQGRSGRGLRFALGEAEVAMDVTPGSV